MTSRKKEIDLGKAGDFWAGYNKGLLEGIRKLYDNHLPYLSSLDDVYNRFVAKYKTLREEYGLKSQINYLLENYGMVFKSYKTMKVGGYSYHVIKEYTEVAACNEIQKNRLPKCLKYKARLNKECLKNKTLLNTEGRVMSQKGICVRREGKNVIYVFPRVLDVDYAKIFKDIFNYRGAEETNVNKKTKDMLKMMDNKPFVPIPIQKEHIVVRYKSKKRKTQIDETIPELATSAYFLIDMLLSSLLGFVITINKESSITVSNNDAIANRATISRIRNVLSKLNEKIGYCYSQQSLLYKELNTAKGNNVSLNRLNERKEIIVLSQISELSKEGMAVIPEFSINMFTVFEIYAFCKASEHISGLRFQPTIKDQNKQNKQPDIMLGNNIVIDAKYKYQYGTDSHYCALIDVQRMVDYLLLLAKKVKAEDGEKPTGFFVSPCITRADSGFELISSKPTETVLKIQLQLPLNIKFLDNCDPNGLLL